MVVVPQVASRDINRSHIEWGQLIECGHTISTMSESWWEYVQRISAHAPNKDIAAAADMDASTVSRWKSGDTPRAANVIAFARGYNRSPLEALVIAGYIQPEELTSGPVHLHASVADITDEELSGEMSRRLASYGNIIEEIQRRAAADDPRKIVPGSADDVFPPFGAGDDADRRAWRS